MSEKTDGTRGSRITVGVFTFVVVALCITAIFGTGINFGAGDTVQSFHPKPASARLAETMIELELDPQLGDEALRSMVEAIVQRATAGDVEAAEFVFQLAAQQRAKHTAELLLTETDPGSQEPRHD